MLSLSLCVCVCVCVFVCVCVCQEVLIHLCDVVRTVKDATGLGTLLDCLALAAHAFSAYPDKAAAVDAASLDNFWC